MKTIYFERSTNKLDYRRAWLVVGRFSIVINGIRYFRAKPELKDWREFSRTLGGVPTISFYWLWFALHWQIEK